MSVLCRRSIAVYQGLCSADTAKVDGSFHSLGAPSRFFASVILVEADSSIFELRKWCVSLRTRCGDGNRLSDSAYAHGGFKLEGGSRNRLSMGWTVNIVNI